MERLTLKRFYALALIPVLLFCLYSPVPEVKASYTSDFIGNVTDYALSVFGYMEKKVDDLGNVTYGVVKKVSQKYSDLFQAVSDALDTGDIFVDSGGNISFNQTATNSLSNVLSGGGGVGGFNAVLLGSNSSFNDFTTNNHVGGSFANGVSQIVSDYPQALYVSWQQYVHDNEISTNFAAYDLSNVAYCGIYSNNNYFTFYDSSYNIISVSYSQVSCSQSYNYTPSTAVTYSGSTNKVLPYTYKSYSIYTNNNDWYVNGANLSLPSIVSSWTTNVKSYNSSDRYSTTFYFTCPSGLIIGSNESNGRGAYNFLRDPSYIITNNVNVLPSVTNNQFNSTSFDNTYNTFVTNVNNIYNDLELPDFDIDIYRGIANDQNQLIINAIGDGVDNITSVIQTQSQKLDTIIGLLMHIRDMLKELPSGTGGSSGSAVSVDLSGIISRLDTLIANNVTSDDFDDTMSDLQDALDSISSSASSNNLQLIAINNKLVDLYVALIGNQNSPRDNPNNPLSNNYYYGDNYWISEYAETDPPDDFMEDNITAFNSLTDSMKNVVPFCFVVMAVNLISAFSSDPVAPVFTIPFNLERFGYEEEVTIDFSEFNTLHVILTDGFSILFLIGMWFLFFRLLKFVLNFL